MKMPALVAIAVVISAVCFAGSARVRACGGYGFLWSEDAQVRESLVRQYRERGPKGLEYAMAMGKLWNLTDEQRTLYNQSLDKIAGQYDGHISGLYWFTNFDKAKAVSAETGKPILTLRMLGNLTDQLSCANSRFFRSTLYANQEIAAYLRENYVLHWESVRPVPVITIDFGDGRKVQSTITGNSVHYVLDSKARTLDALPGLYGPQAFLQEVTELHDVAQSTTPMTEEQFADWRISYHNDELKGLDVQWQMKILPVAQKINPNIKSIEHMSADSWSLVGMHFAKNVQFDHTSRTLIESHLPPGTAERAMRAAVSKSFVESPVLQAIRQLRQNIAADTLLNEQKHRRLIHQWFANPRITFKDVNDLNNAVYTTVFDTPRSDPWLGLMQPGGYTGVTNAGAIVPEQLTKNTIPREVH